MICVGNVTWSQINVKYLCLKGNSLLNKMLKQHEDQEGIKKFGKLLCNKKGKIELLYLP